MVHYFLVTIPLVLADYVPKVVALPGILAPFALGTGINTIKEGYKVRTRLKIVKIHSKMLYEIQKLTTNMCRTS